MTPQFDFGENWKHFSRHALDEERVKDAALSFELLCEGVPLRGEQFLDIGFGQGLGLLNAANLGAFVVGCDINDKCATALEENRRFFPRIKAPIPVVVGSILEAETIAKLRALSPTGDYRVVHSWGVLHHTGNMRKAITNSASLVMDQGYLIIAIYNKHWSSPLWLYIKRFYMGSPHFLRRTIVLLLLPLIFCAKFLVRGREAFRQERGMDFSHDVVDWVGGYPYEYATRSEIELQLLPLGFKLQKFFPARVPTGCNEFIFRKT